MSTSRSDQCSRSGRTDGAAAGEGGAQPGAEPAELGQVGELLAPEFPEPLRQARRLPERHRHRLCSPGPVQTASPRHGSGRVPTDCAVPVRAPPTAVSPGSCAARELGSRHQTERPGAAGEILHGRPARPATRSARPASAERVLAAWAASPARFREDANAEEDLVRGGYRDRLLVELAQNAADAAARAGVPGRLRLELAGDDAAGREHRRAAGRRRRAGAGDAARVGQAGRRRRRVGRFGVGFAAVLAVSDEPAVGQHGRRGAVQRRAAPAAEVAARARRWPTSWPAAAARCRCCGCRGRPTATPPERVRHRGGPAAARRAPGAAVAAALAELPADAAARAARAAVDRGRRGRRRPHAADDRSGRTVGHDHRRRRGRRSGGSRSAPASCPPPCSPTGRSRSARAAAGRSPGRCRWTTTAAPRPLPAGQVVHAPTPSDEPLSLPLRLIAPFPLGPDRRHVAPGPVTDVLVGGRRGRLRRPACRRCRPTRRVLRARAADRPRRRGARRRARRGGARPAARHRLAARRPGRPASGSRPDAGRRAGRGDRRPGGRAGRGAARPAAGRLVAALGPPGARPRSASGGSAWPRRWRRSAGWRGRRRGGGALYAALDGADREELAALPVPLADGRTAHGPAGVLLPDAGLPVERLGPLGLRLAVPGAVAPAAARRAAGAARARGPATAAAVLADPAVRAAVEGSMDAVDDALDDGPDPEDLARRGPRAGGRRAAGGRGAAVAGRAGAARRRRRLGAGRRTGAAGVAAGRRAGPAAPWACWTRSTAATADPDALRAVGVLDTFAAGPRDRTPTSWTSTAPTVGRRRPRPAAPRRTAARLAAADRGARPGAGRDWPRALPLLAAAPAEARADVVLARGRGAGVSALVAGTHPVLDGERPDRLRHPDEHGVTGTVRTRRPPSRRCWTLLRPPADGRRRAGRRRRRDRPARPARRSAPHGAARGAADRLRPAGGGAGRRRRRPAGARAGRTGPGGRGRRRPRRPVPAATGRSAGRARRGRARRGGRPARPARWPAELVHGDGDGRPASRTRWASCRGPELAAARLGVDELTGEVAVHEALVVGGRAVAGGRTGERRPRRRHARRARSGAGLARRGLAAAAGAGRGVRLSRAGAAELAAEDARRLSTQRRLGPLGLLRLLAPAGPGGPPSGRGPCRGRPGRGPTSPARLARGPVRVLEVGCWSQSRASTAMTRTVAAKITRNAATIGFSNRKARTPPTMSPARHGTIQIARDREVLPAVSLASVTGPVSAAHRTVEVGAERSPSEVVPVRRVRSRGPSLAIPPATRTVGPGGSTASRFPVPVFE